MIRQLEFSYADFETTGESKRSRLVNMPPSNAELAAAFQEVATFLQVQGANRFRVEAYYRAVNVLLSLDQPVWEIYDSKGIAGLEELPAIGREHLASIATVDSRWTLAVAGAAQW